MTINELRVNTLEWLVRYMCEYMVEVALNRLVLKQKMEIKLTVLCHSLIFPLCFCSGQFLCITGGYVMFLCMIIRATKIIS
jgi:hypothetical protein